MPTLGLFSDDEIPFTLGSYDIYRLKGFGIFQAGIFSINRLKHKDMMGEKV